MLMAQENSLEIPIPKPDTSWRRNPDGTYNDKPSDPEYFKKYYHAKLKTPGEWVCEYCGNSLFTKRNYNRHQKYSKTFQMFQAVLGFILC